jgi:hypothetical protein
MPGGVGILVEDQKSVLTAADNEVGGVITGGGGFGQKVLTIGSLAAEIFDAPGSPEVLEMFFGKAHDFLMRLLHRFIQTINHCRRRSFGSGTIATSPESGDNGGKIR